MPDLSRRNRVLTLWGHNEALLQSYRALSMTSQSFFLTVGAIVASAENSGLLWVMVLFLFFTMSQIQIWYIWVPITRVRGGIVNYYKNQYMCDLDEAQLAKLEALCGEEAFVHNSELRAQVMTDYFQKFQDRKGFTTRWKMDILLPLMFASGWMLLLAWVILPVL